MSSLKANLSKKQTKFGIRKTIMKNKERRRRKRYLNEIDKEAREEEEQAQWNDDSCRCNRHGPDTHAEIHRFKELKNEWNLIQKIGIQVQSN